jgi:hypothetical protein
MKQDMLTLREAAPNDGTGVTDTEGAIDATTPAVLEEAAEQPASDTAASAPAERLFAAVRALVEEELTIEKTEAQIVEILGVTKPQGKAWLKRWLAEGIVEKVKKSKPAKYRAVERLL